MSERVEILAGTGARKKSAVARLMALVGTHNVSLLIALAILVAIFGSLRPDVFFLVRNLENIGQAIAILGVLATAQTIVIVSGGLDISVGAVVGVSTVCIALMVERTGSTALSIAVRRGGGRGGRAGQRTDHHGGRRQRGDRHLGHHGSVPRRGVHFVQRPVDQHFRPGFPLHRRRAACWVCR